MVDRPIIFSAPMVRALLDGRKTQTRRIIKPRPNIFDVAPGTPCEVALEYADGEPWPRIRLGRVITRQEVRFRPGLKLWVRETCRAEELEDGTDSVRYVADDAFQQIESTTGAAEAWGTLFHYRGRGKGRRGNVVPPIHMPRWASRLTLTVTEMRVQRLQEISEADALAEGCAPRVDPYQMTARQDFGQLWQAIHGPDAWAENPEVVALTFTVARTNIDA